jgi:uncharacterized membrane protein
MKHIEFKKYTYIWISIGLILLMDVAILLNIPILRQILGIIFLTILPGLIILRSLKLIELEFTEKLVLSVGLSVSFVMFFGLLLNSISLSFGFKSPLSTLPLLISMNVAVVALIFTENRLNKNITFSLSDFNLNISEKILLIVPILFPALCMFGVYLMNVTNSSVILIFLLVLILIYVIFVCIFNQIFSSRLYPIIIFLIGISLVLMEALRSSHIIGIDSHSEYYLFQATLGDSYWSPIRSGTPLDACLSISLLPTIYQLFLNVNPEIFFNVFYVFISSLIPLVIFLISKKYVGDFYGFLASIFLIFQSSFIFSTGVGRTNAALFFLALAIMTLFNEKINLIRKRFLFIIFFASCIVSHYTTTYIFFFMLIGTVIVSEILSIKYRFKKILNLWILILFFAMIFFWYSHVTETAFSLGVDFLKHALETQKDFFSIGSRGKGEALLGQDIMQKGIPHKIQFIFTWLSFALIGIGILTLIKRYKEMSFPELNIKCPEFLIEKFEVEYVVLALNSVGLLAATIAVPQFSMHYSLDRTFSVAITVLSVFFVIGCITLAAKISLGTRDSLDKQKEARRGDKRGEKKNALQVRAYLIILIVLIPYFFSTTGLTYHIFGYSRTITLDSEGTAFDIQYVRDQESESAKWLGKYAEVDKKIYSDFEGRILESQGKIAASRINSEWFASYVKMEGYIYLRCQNVLRGILINPDGIPKNYNMTNYQDLFIKSNEIFDDGSSKIYLKSNPSF